ncbi:hypothetical protein SAMN05444159_1234 [Bradyrhizobium lablabi]|uniref:HNH endonuclease n=1 Tax=Bradyrhizobium lablabi TaxID=722472 RepID=A0A1M6LC86_9BRAD|nr:hypothetical protein SAMN05444159_1234 [Bradyrhizobium lablabi]
MSDSKTRDWLEAHRDYAHEDRCLIWPFTRDRRDGRGRTSLDGERRAHPIMCKMVNGPPPADKPQAAHSCGNGHLGCVNPRHLSWANNSENQHQRYAHGRANSHTQGSRSQFTPEQIETIRSQWGEFTQERLAEMYGVSISTIQYYLNDREKRGHDGVKHWSSDDDDQLRQGVAEGLSLNQLAALVGRSRKATEHRVYRIGLTSGQRPTPKKERGLSEEAGGRT